MFLTPRWLASHVFVVALIAAFVAAGLWQLERLDRRRAENERIEARLDESVDLSGVDPATSELEFVRVTMEGSYDTDRARDILVGNRVANGSPGFWIWSVFDLADGSEIMVNRGFANRAAVLQGGDRLDPPPGPTLVAGRLRRGIDSGSLSDDGFEITRPDAALIASDRSVDSRFDPSLYVEVISQEPDDVDAIEPVPAPELGDGPHLSYAFQWFTFAILGTVGYGLVLRRITRGDAARGDVPY